jgi:hypothetical protein
MVQEVPLRLLKNAHLLRFPYPSSLRRTSKYASFLRISGALHLGIFEQLEKFAFSATANVQSVGQSVGSGVGRRAAHDLFSLIFSYSPLHLQKSAMD